jgi:hypothetical protein
LGQDQEALPDKVASHLPPLMGHTQRAGFARVHIPEEEAGTCVNTNLGVIPKPKGRGPAGT